VGGMMAMRIIVNSRWLRVWREADRRLYRLVIGQRDFNDRGWYEGQWGIDLRPEEWFIRFNEGSLNFGPCLVIARSQVDFMLRRSLFFGPVASRGGWARNGDGDWFRYGCIA
jgi:hypothetical protein